MTKDYGKPEFAKWERVEPNFSHRPNSGRRQNVNWYLMHAPAASPCKMHRERETPPPRAVWIISGLASVTRLVPWCGYRSALCAWSSWASLPCRNTPFALLQYFHRGMQRIDTTECAHPLTHIARPFANLFAPIYAPNAHKAPHNDNNKRAEIASKLQNIWPNLETKFLVNEIKLHK